MSQLKQSTYLEERIQQLEHRISDCKNAARCACSSQMRLMWQFNATQLERTQKHLKECLKQQESISIKESNR